MEGTYFRKVVNSDHLNIDLPKELKNRKVEIIVFPYEKKDRKRLMDKVKGIWKDTDIDLHELRTKAWNRQ